MPKGQFTLGNRAQAAKAIRKDIYDAIRALKALGMPIGINLGAKGPKNTKKAPKGRQGG